MTARKGGLDVKYNTYGGALVFHSFFQTGGKVVEELLEFRYHTNIGIKLTIVSSLRCSDAMNCCFSICHAEGKEWLCYIC